MKPAYGNATRKACPLAAFASPEGRLAPALRWLLVSITLVGFHRVSDAQLRPPELIIVNATIRTMTSRDATAEALAVTGNRISAVGKNAEIKKFAGPGTRVIDAGGKPILPGFNDSHVHFMGIGNTFSSMDLREVKSGVEVIERIKRYVSFLPKGRWILGSGLPKTVGDSLTRKSLDEVSPANPIFLYYSGASTALANTSAFDRARLKDDATSIVSGDAMRRIAHVVPQDHTRNWPEIAEAATNYAASLGVTSVQDMHSDDSRAIYLELQKQGKLKTRVYDCLGIRERQKLLDTRLPKSSGAMVTDGCLKAFSDGDAAEAGSLQTQIAAADKVGIQVMVHAIGNSANRIVLAAFEQTTKRNGVRDRRFRVEHAHNPLIDDLPRFARSKIVASMQPKLFEYGEGEYYATLLKQGASLALGSDAAMIDLDPLLGIHAAVNAAVESISVYDAVRSYTVGSAFAEFQEKEKGTIETGKLADFVILSDDIFTLDRSTIHEAKVLRTFVDGREVYYSGEN
ncbi:MAG TPA: amidohydrolase [Pyrinomonadaceae bacterium]|nr:amidohydrolase [Pyrinomonadaceae bacterium]